MTTQRNHTPRRQPQYAKYATCQPSHSASPTVTCYSTPSLNAPQETMPNSRSAKFDKILRKFVCARARTHVHVVFLPSSHVIPAKAGILMPPPLATSGPPTSFPRRRESSCRRRWQRSLLSVWITPRPQWIRRIPWSCRPGTLMPIDRTEPANRLCLTLHSAGFTMEGAAWHSPSGQYW